MFGECGSITVQTKLKQEGEEGGGGDRNSNVIDETHDFTCPPSSGSVTRATGWP